MIGSLDRKVLRDVARMRTQLVAVALVIAAGIGSFLGLRSTMGSLESARSNYYAHQRLAHVFAGLVRAPEHVADELAAIEGVQRIQTRVVAAVTLDVPGMTDVATARLVSLPDRGRPQLNDVRLRSGRMPQPGRGEEVIVSEPFAEAHGFPLGTRIGAIINGSWEELKVVGTGLSPEFTYTIGPGLIFPDDRRFGIFWMRRAALGPAFDMEGAFNDVSLQLVRDASTDDVIEQVDDVLERYGGLGAVARKDQQSAFFIENELKQLRTFATLVPTLFLAVAAFLLNIIVGRIVAGQREQIATLKALGYSDREVGLHFAKLVGLVIALGLVGGIALGGWMGMHMTRVYSLYYRFPELPFQMGLADAVQAIGISLVAAVVGASAAIYRTVRLPPAEALRPEAPHAYRATLVERLGLADLLSVPARMVLRELERKPWRAIMSVAGIAMATGLIVLTTFTFDAFWYMLEVQFGLGQRDDVQLTLVEPRSTGVLSELEQLPGVMHAEPYRAVPVRLRHGARTKNTAITGIPRDATLYRILDERLEHVEAPREGIVLARQLADSLGVEAGDTIQVEVLEGARPIREVRVARLAETFIGLSAHMDLVALCGMLGEATSLNGAWLSVDEGRMDDLHAAVKETPIVAGVAMRNETLKACKKIMDENLGTSMTISLGLSLVMALGVLYNAARITLAERSRELASLRVLGFRRREVSAILLGEVALLVVVAIPIGLAFGRLMAFLMVSSAGFNNDQFRIPLVISPKTNAVAVVTILIAAAISCWNVWRRLDQIDIVEVLKTRD